MLVGFLFLLLISDGVSSEKNCSYQDVLNYLNLSKTNELFSMTRPVKNYKNPTEVSLEVLLYAILDVVEKDQKFIPYVWTIVRWQNEYISWDPDEFCGINNVSLPTDTLWKPDLTIEEMTEKDKAPPSPYLTINHKGDVEVQNDQVLVSTCKMHIYKFPFDSQSCDLSFKSVVYNAEEVKLTAVDNSTEATESSLDVIRTQYEWVFINMAISTRNASNSADPDVVVYTINMKRKPTLYIVNFLLPVFFFLCLDLTSFLISENGGEKLSFKVTVLLAVTVLQLILNEILPASSNTVPLIAIYCIGIFALMMLSLLETIFIMYLIEKDSKNNETNKDQSLRGECNKHGISSLSNYSTEANRWSQGGCIHDGSTSENLSELLPISQEGSSSNRIEEWRTLEKLSVELKKMERTMSLLFKKNEDRSHGYWIRVAKKFNKCFFIFYVTMISVFLAILFIEWF